MNWVKLNEGGEFAQTPLYKFTITSVPETDNLLSVLVEKEAETVTRFTGFDMLELKKDCEVFWKEVKNEIAKY